MRYDWAYRAKHLIADSTRSLSPVSMQKLQARIHYQKSYSVCIKDGKNKHMLISNHILVFLGPFGPILHRHRGSRTPDWLSTRKVCSFQKLRLVSEFWPRHTAVRYFSAVWRRKKQGVRLAEHRKLKRMVWV